MFKTGPAINSGLEIFQFYSIKYETKSILVETINYVPNRQISVLFLGCCRQNLLYYCFVFYKKRILQRYVYFFLLFPIWYDICTMNTKSN